MNPSPALLAPTDPSPLTLRQRLQLVPPARIIAAEEESGSLLTQGDLSQFSKYLAREFDHDAQVAAEHAPIWYAEQIEHCTLEQARTVRTMTIESCKQVTLLREYDRTLLPVGAMAHRAEALDAFGVTALLLLLLVVVPMAVDGCGGKKPAGPETAPAAPHTAVTR